MRIKIILLAATLLICCVATSIKTEAVERSVSSVLESEEPIPFEVLAKPGFGIIAEERNQVVSTRKQWKKLWKEMHSRITFERPPLPEVDFDQRMLIAIFRGPYNLGYSFSVQKVSKSEDGIQVHIKETHRVRNCVWPALVTFPYLIIETERLEKSLRNNLELFVEKEIRDCEPSKPVIVVDNLDPAQWKQAPLSIVEATLISDILKLKVTYAGGCRDHEFELPVSSTFMESHPVQTVSLLAHDAKDDNCEALVTRELAFDLSPLKIEYQKAYQTRSGVILLRLAGVSAPLRYEF